MRYSSITRIFLFCIPCFFFASCWKFNYGYDTNAVRAEAYVPVYSNDSAQTHSITSLPARPIKMAGKIYVQGTLLFQVETMVGVHLVSYADPLHPVKLGFIKSWGCSEVAFKNGYLVVNNLNDLVFIDVRDLSNIKEASRVSGAFPQFNSDQYYNSRPPVTGKYYVCPDFSKGEIVDWKLEKNVTGAYCSN